MKPMFLPSPHISRQVLSMGEVKSVVHTNPVSTSHNSEHPSPESELPSSHSSKPSTMKPSLQSNDHSSAVIGVPPSQTQPFSTKQVLSHPSPLIKLPSSQFASVSTMTKPSPHRSEQSSGVYSSPPKHM